MKPRICLLDDWRRVLRRAWSIRFSLLAAAFTAAEVVVPIFGDVLPRDRGSAMNLIPWPYRLLALATLPVVLIGFGWIKGAGHVQARWDASVQQQALHATAVRERQAQATVEVVTEYVDRLRVVREKGGTIIKEVPVYVPVQADAACSINRGFVCLHDAAAAGDLPEPAGDADAAAAGLALSAVAETVAGNYQSCHENAEQLRALQTWVRAMGQGTEGIKRR